MIKYLILAFPLVGLMVSLTTIDKKEVKTTLKTLNSKFSFVPSGNVALDSQTVSVQSFIMLKTEVANLDYRTFLNELKAAGEIDKWNIAQFDTSNWTDGKMALEAFKTYYHVHPAYAHYPAVNVSKEGATLYCQWLSNKMNAALPEGQKISFRLPTKAEWLMAAKGNLENAVYSWGSPYLSDAKGNSKCNYLAYGAENITKDENNEYHVVWTGYYAGFTATGVDILAPVESYWPNAFGLYNMNGNAAELLGDCDEVIGGSWRDPGYDVRNESVKPYSKSAVTTGFRVVATVDPARMPWLKVKK